MRVGSLTCKHDGPRVTVRRLGWSGELYAAVPVVAKQMGLVYVRIVRWREERLEVVANEEPHVHLDARVHVHAIAMRGAVARVDVRVCGEGGAASRRDLKLHGAVANLP